MKRILVLLLCLLSAPALAQVSTLPSTNLSVSITTGLTYQLVQALSAGRRSLTIQNNNATDNCYLDVSGVVVAGNTTATSVTVNGVSITAIKASILLIPGAGYTRYYPFVPNGPIVATCVTTADSLYVDFQ